MMRLIFLGTASAFVTDNDNYQSNMLLQSSSGRCLLIDCGSDVRRSLQAQHLTHHDITDVYISHLHADHCGGLEWLAFARKFDEDHLPKANLFVPEPLAKPLWEHTLSGGLTSLSDEPASLEAFFQVCATPASGSFTWEGLRFQLVKNVHILSDYAEMPSYGLLFQINQKMIFITTDAQFQPEFMSSYYQQADVIFHDCETSTIPSGVHAHYEQLKTLPTEIKQKMWLYHYNSSNLPDARSDDFAGFVQPGQCFKF